MSTTNPNPENPEDPEDLEDLEDPEFGDEMGDDEFDPMPSDYMIRQQQIATYQMLCQFLTTKDKNIADLLNDIRLSIDCLTKCVIKLNKNLEEKSVPQFPPFLEERSDRGT